MKGSADGMETQNTGREAASGTGTPSTVFRYKQRHSLNAIFEPRSVAVIGATEKAGSVGRTLLWNLVSHPFGGMIFPVHPKHESVLGIKAYPNVAAVPRPIDLAVIATPALTVPGLIAECVAAGVRGAIILSAGFKETGEQGAEMERQLLEYARRGKMRIIGPNCLGVMSPLTGLNASFAGVMARPGHLGFISQSGALGTAVFDWSLGANVGFSTFVSIGSMIDVGWGDLIDYLGSDPQTTSIVLYLETIGDARSFLSAARDVARHKPIIVIKAGQTQEAVQAAVSHTGALAGSYEVFEAASRRSGVLPVKHIEELFSLAEVLARQPRPQGPRLTILTNAGGPGVLATDALVNAGGQLAELSPQSRAALDQILPPHWSHANPIDVLGDADPERYARALEIAAQDPNSDGLLVILTPQAMTDPTLTAQRLTAYATRTRNPLLASWMGGASVASGTTILNQAGIPTFAYPDTAVEVFDAMWRSISHLRGIYETPLPSFQLDEGGPDRPLVTQLLASVRQSGRTLLTECESKQILAAYGIPIVETRVASSDSEAVACAEEIGYPVVLKLLSETITHKTDVGGVQLHLAGPEEVRRAFHAIEMAVRDTVGVEHFQGVTVQPMISRAGYELILGSGLDPQFGPVLLFGSGGQLVEVYNTNFKKRRAMSLWQIRLPCSTDGHRGPDFLVSRDAWHPMSAHE